MYELVRMVLCTNILELISIYALIACLVSWLAKSKTPLIELMYICSGIYFISLWAHFYVLSAMICKYSAGLLCACVVLHHRALQRHFIAYHQAWVSDYSSNVQNWLELTLRFLLQTASLRQKSCHYIIRFDQTIEPFITTGLPVNVALSNSTLKPYQDVIQPDLYLVSTQKGILLSVNSTIKSSMIAHSAFEQILQFSTHTDCIIIIVHPQHYFSIVHNAHALENVSFSTTLRIIKQKITLSQKDI